MKVFKVPQAKRPYTDRQVSILKVMNEVEGEGWIRISRVAREIGLNDINGVPKTLVSFRRLLKEKMIIQDDDSKQYRLTEYGKRRLEDG
jgi:predicted transcriptional regulator